MSIEGEVSNGLKSAAVAVLLFVAATGGLRAEPAVVVRTHALGTLTEPLVLSAPANVVSLADSRLSVELTARLDSLPVRVGETVDAGTVLARLDCSRYAWTRRQLAAQLDALDARHRNALRQRERARSLQRQRTLADEVVDERETAAEDLAAQIEAQQAALALARRDEALCVVEAPFAGVIVERYASEGELLNPGTPLLRLLDTGRTEVSAHVLEADVDSLARDGALYFRATTGPVYAVTIRSLPPVVDAVTGTREVRLGFSDARPPVGSRGRLEWSAGPALPAAYLVRRDGAVGVLAAMQGHARFVPIPGALEGQPALVAALDVALPVIVEGRLGLSDGDAIILGD